MIKLNVGIKREPVQLEVGGELKDCHLCSLPVSRREEYLTWLRKRAEAPKQGEVEARIEDITGIQAHLVNLCLTDPEGQPFGEETITEWSGDAVFTLFREAQRINKLGPQVDDEPEGKDSKASD